MNDEGLADVGAANPFAFPGFIQELVRSSRSRRPRTDQLAAHERERGRTRETSRGFDGPLCAAHEPLPDPDDPPQGHGLARAVVAGGARARILGVRAGAWEAVGGERPDHAARTAAGGSAPGA